MSKPTSFFQVFLATSLNHDPCQCMTSVPQGTKGEAAPYSRSITSKMPVVLLDSQETKADSDHQAIRRPWGGGKQTVLSEKRTQPHKSICWIMDPFAAQTLLLTPVPLPHLPSFGCKSLQQNPAAQGDTLLIAYAV